MSAKRPPKRGSVGLGICLSVFAAAACTGPTDQTGATPSESGRSSAIAKTLPTSKPSGTPSTSRPPSGVESCQALLDDDWAPPSTAPDISYDPTSGIAVIHLDSKSFKFDVLNDKACRRLPTLGPIIKRLIREASQFSD